MSQDSTGQFCELTLLVRGVHCAACIHKIESTLLQQCGAAQARQNFSSGQLVIRWDGSPDQADDFVRAVVDLGYGVSPYSAEQETQSQSAQGRELLTCLGVAGFAMGNIMLLSLGLWITTEQTMGFATRELLHWLSALIALPAIIFSGRPFFKSAWAALSKGHTNMDVPISLALILACGMSVFETIRGAEHAFFDSAVMLMFFLLIGRYLDFLARRQAHDAAQDLLQTLNGFAVIVHEDGRSERILVRDLRSGMIVLVSAGQTIPCDGDVMSGISDVDMALVTGESLPVSVQVGSQVYAGTLNLNAPLRVRVAKASGQSLLADIVRMIEDAQQSHARYVRLADRAARLYTPVVHSLALLAFLLWLGVWAAPWQDALRIAITVLIITCPCALGLAVPVVQVLASGRLMRAHILLKSGDALERLAKIDTVLFDKTGTLTQGRPQLLDAQRYAPEDLQLAASLAVHSAHPVSKAMVQAYGDLPLLTFDEGGVRDFSGQGLEAFYQGQRVRLGQHDWCTSGMPISGEDKAQHLRVTLQREGAMPVCFEFSDLLRDNVADVVQTFRSAGLECIVISGDRPAAVKNMAQQAGIDIFYGACTPADKYKMLQDLKAQGRHILMVGDGLNDAPVLAGADVSIAPGSAIDMAQNAADIVFMGASFAPVAEAWQVARRSQHLVHVNFALAILYNIVAVPFAILGFVTPLFAALAMSGSSLLVLLNSFRLKWFKTVCKQKGA